MVCAFVSLWSCLRLCVRLVCCSRACVLSWVEILRYVRYSLGSFPPVYTRGLIEDVGIPTVVCVLDIYISWHILAILSVSVYGESITPS